MFRGCFAYSKAHKFRWANPCVTYRWVYGNPGLSCNGKLLWYFAYLHIFNDAIFKRFETPIQTVFCVSLFSAASINAISIFLIAAKMNNESFLKIILLIANPIKSQKISRVDLAPKPVQVLNGRARVWVGVYFFGIVINFIGHLFMWISPTNWWNTTKHLLDECTEWS